MTNLSARLEITDEPVSSEVTVHLANEVLVGGELLALDDFVAGVLHRAYETVETLRSPGEHRTILRIAHLFADRLAATHLPFDRLHFIEAATEASRDA
jgi:small nuclear ribonucleoprotein (snRNP)-like protein